MPDSLVLDTNVIIFGSGGHEDFEVVMECAGLVSTILDGNEWRLVIDTDDKILDEYRSNLRNQNHPLAEAFRKFIQKQVYHGQKIVKRYPIDRAEVQELLDNDFDPDDIILVRVAPKSDMKTIVSYDYNSFLEGRFQEWLENNLDIKTMKPRTFREKYSI